MNAEPDEFKAWLHAELQKDYDRLMEIEIAMLTHQMMWGVPVGPHPAMLRWPHLYGPVA